MPDPIPEVADVPADVPAVPAGVIAAGAPVPAAAAALTTAFEALSRTSMLGAAPIVVDALAAADRLQTPGENTELRRLLAMATGYSALYRQECENQLHREWFADVAQAVFCPWCEIDRLHAVYGPAVAS